MAEFAEKGSQRWLQTVIALRPALIDEPIKRSLRLSSNASIDWRSPLKRDGFQELRDMEALRSCGIDQLAQRSLANFWPRRGPVWDALAVAGGEIILVEAKAHIAEMASPGTKANPDALELIRKSLEEARQHFAPRATKKWDDTFYQYANRLAHLYLLRHLNGVQAHLVFVYFLNATDVDGPSSELEWQGAIQLLHAALGLSKEHIPYVHDVYVDVSPLR